MLVVKKIGSVGKSSFVKFYFFLSENVVKQICWIFLDQRSRGDVYPNFILQNKLSWKLKKVIKNRHDGKLF